MDKGVMQIRVIRTFVGHVKTPMQPQVNGSNRAT